MPKCFGKGLDVDYQNNCLACVYRDNCVRAVAISSPTEVYKPEMQVSTAMDVQVAGDHYRTMKVQPAEYCHANNIGKLEGDAIYYLSRWRNKNGVEDLLKARHTIDLLIELEKKYG